jgi:hypothetical protein
MNLLSKLPKLAEQAPSDPGIINIRYTKDLLLAAPAMLEVLGKFQPGDSERLRSMLSGYAGWLSSLLTEEDKHMLARLQEACQLMEAEYEAMHRIQRSGC